MTLTYPQFLSDSSMHCAQTIRDPLWKDIAIPAYLVDVIKSPSFVKLGRIKQLGVAFHLYPGAVHTRLNHSLGVMHLSHKIISSLLRRERAEGRLSLAGVRHFLAATLLHDIGHFPFTHSLKELPLKTHEQLAAELLEADHQLQAALRQADLDTSLIGLIIDEDQETDDEEVLLFRSILSGALDPDKLDYLNRDAYFAGVPYGIQDVSYITDHLTLHEGRLAITEEALGSVEHLLFSKYLMYRNVYWHKATRSATAMIKRYLYENLQAGGLKEEQLYGLDDEGFFLLGQEQRSLDLLLNRVRENRFYQPIIEEPFNEKNFLHRHALNLERRSAFEEQIEDTLGLEAGSVVIDIPEQVSFESDIPVIGSEGYLGAFEDIDPLFSHSQALQFTSSLRTVRLFGDHSINKEQAKKAWEQIRE